MDDQDASLTRILDRFLIEEPSIMDDSLSKISRRVPCFFSSSFWVPYRGEFCQIFTFSIFLISECLSWFFKQSKFYWNFIFVSRTDFFWEKKVQKSTNDQSWGLLKIILVWHLAYICIFGIFFRKKAIIKVNT